MNTLNTAHDSNVYSYRRITCFLFHVANLLTEDNFLLYICITLILQSGNDFFPIGLTTHGPSAYCKACVSPSVPVSMF